MGTVTIKEPFWKANAIGLNPKYLEDKDLVIRISYTDERGKLLFPHKYRLDYSKLVTYDTYTVKGVKLILVPIRDLIKIV